MALLRDFFDEIVVRLIPSRNTPLNKLTDEDRELVVKLKEESLIDLSDKKLVCLADVTHKLERDKLPGLFVEVGCKLGGSTILLAHIKNPRRPMQVYDLFEDSQASEQQNHTPATGTVHNAQQAAERNSYELVKANLKKFGITLEQYTINLIQGAHQDTVAIKQQVAFVHINLNDYDVVKVCLQRISPWVPIDGSLFISSYDTGAECRRAVDEFLSERAGKFLANDTAGARTLTRLTF